MEPADAANSREIEVYCEGFGAGPGCGWFLRLTFTASEGGGYAVFLSTDVEDLDEDSADDESGEQQERGRLIAQLTEPLTWREVARFVASRESLQIYDDGASFTVEGLQPWQGDAIAVAMLRPDLEWFLAGLPEEELELLHERFENLTSEEVLTLLEELAWSVDQAGLQDKSLCQIATDAGVQDLCDLEALTEALGPFREAEKIRRAALAAGRFLTQHGDDPPADAFLELLDYEPLTSTSQRARLFALWLRMDPKPKGGRLGEISTTPSECPLLRWLLVGHVLGIFEALEDDHRSELEQFVRWYLGEARAHARSMANLLGNGPNASIGRAYHSFWTYLGKEVQAAADSLDLTIPDEVRMQP